MTHWAYRIRLAQPEDAEAYVAAHVTSQIATYAHLMPPEHADPRQAEAAIAAAELAVDLATMHDDLAAGREPFRRHWGAAAPPRGGNPGARTTPGGGSSVAAGPRGILGIACAGAGQNWWEANFDPPPVDVPYMLDRLYLRPQAQGSGVGQALFEAAVGDRSAYLWIIANNPRAERFYVRNGFSPDGAAGPAGGPWLGRPMFRMVRRT
ncbi:MAG: GNAT family N-acetyltransferase [Propionibacteriaceae bacterium]|nr:GNAT family N-acetyltransferase [Propionibacteriaceae bacterium]